MDIGDTPLEISTEVMEDKESKEEDGSEVIKVYIFKAEADDDLGKLHLSLSANIMSVKKKHVVDMLSNMIK